jgi:hypothetical protein
MVQRIRFGAEKRNRAFHMFGHLDGIRPQRAGH